jgi:hypothetical protein
MKIFGDQKTKGQFVQKSPTNALILISLLFPSVTPTCFVTCVPSSESASVPAQLQADLGLWLIKFCVIRGYIGL